MTVLARPAAVGVAGKAVELAGLAILLSLVPRALGPHDYGVFSLALASVSLAGSVVAIGGPTLLTRYPGLVEPARAREVLGELMARAAVVRFAAVVAFAAAAAVAVLAGWLPATPTAFGVVALFLETAATLRSQAGLGAGAVVSWSFRYPFQNAVLLAAVLVLHEHWGATGSVAAVTVATGAGLVFVLITTPRLTGSWGRGAPLPAGARRFAIAQGVSSAMLQVIQRGAVPLAAAIGAAGDEIGFTALAAGVAAALSYVVAQVFVTELGRQSRLEDGEGEREVMRAATIAVVVVVPAVLIGVLAVESTLGSVLGDAYARGAGALAIALASLPLAAVAAALNSVAALRLRPELRIPAGVVGVSTFVGATFVLVPRAGADGAAGAVFLGLAATVLVAALTMREKAWWRVSCVSLAGGAACLVAAVAWT